MVDARGLSCPLPVVMVQEAVKKGNPSELEVMVDSMVCVENVSRFAKNAGYSVAVEEKDEEFVLKLSK